jgi:hypothetical protein
MMSMQGRVVVQFRSAANPSDKWSHMFHFVWHNCVFVFVFVSRAADTGYSSAEISSIQTEMRKHHKLKKKLNTVAWVRKELYRPSEDRLSARSVQTFADWECYAVSVTDPYGGILGFLNRSLHFFFQAAPQLYSRGWLDPVPDPLLLRKSDRAGNL